MAKVAPRRVITKKILRDEDLLLVSKNSEYQRSERVKNTVNALALIAIWLGAIIVFIMVAGVILWYLYIGDFESLRGLAFAGLSFIVGYLISYLRQNGINNG